MHLDLWQWIFGAAAALIVGISKTGVPGVGILVVALLAYAFGGRSSVGIMLPMLIFGDVFAVAWYRRHAQWPTLIGLLPWVVVGMGLGAAGLQVTAKMGGSKDVLNLIIAILILVMLTLHLLQKRLNLTPKSPAGVAFTGATAGFATTVSNAAGPVMQIYLSAHKLAKEQFMGTIAWYFFIINTSKVPIFLYLTYLHPDKPMITMESFKFNLITFPVVLAGVFIGKWMLPRISQKAFDFVVLVLAAASALKVIIAWILGGG